MAFRKRLKMAYTSGRVKKTDYYTKIENKILSATDLATDAALNSKFTKIKARNVKLLI